MRKILCNFLAATTLLTIVGCRRELPPVAPPRESDAAPAKRLEKIRPPAVAGLFYPGEAADLKREVDRLLKGVKSEPIGNLRALVCPHAGYEFSGKAAAVGFKQLEGRDFSTVILLGPSHYVDFIGAFVSTADAYRTPLGLVPVSPEAAELARLQPFTADPRCRVVRPGWWRRSPARPPPDEKDTPETWEHSLEVQLPFLQRTLRDFSVLPIVFGRVNPRAAADRLLPLLDRRTVIVLSTDLSHYLPYAEAEARDARTIHAIRNLDGDELTGEDACGHAPLRALIEVARRKNWEARLLDYRNSGDATGDKSAVVGYAAIAFFDPSGAAADAPQLTPAERRLLLDLARASVMAAVSGDFVPNPPEGLDASSKLRERRACFVTLTKHGKLRGCIGGIFPQEPLCEAVIRRAGSAAIEDRRFPPVRAEELDEIEVEVSVLSVPKPLKFSSPQDLLAKLRPGIDGVLLRVGGREATFLPQVWKQLPDRRLFLDQLAMKAGLSADAWTRSDASVMTYQVEAFKEEGGGRRAGRFSGQLWRKIQLKCGV